VVLGIVGWALGIDPSVLIGGAEVLSGAGQPQVQAPPSTARRTGKPQDEAGRFVNRVLNSTDDRWKEVFAQDGRTYRPPVLVLYRGQTRAQCGGAAQSAMGPFYCPADQSLSRHIVLRSDRDALSRLRCRQQIVPVLAGLCDCA
jgi:predicted metalloprotease